jgi:hypothetical protein
MKARLLTVSCLVAALALYALGWGPSANLFVALGLFAESLFWFRLFRRRR